MSKHFKPILYIIELKTQMLSYKNDFKWMCTRSIVSKRYDSVVFLFYRKYYLQALKVIDKLRNDWKLNINGILDR